MDALGVLQRLGTGHLMEDLAAALAEVAERVVATEKDGTVTVTFKVQKVSGQAAVVVKEAIKQGPPVPEARGAMFFAVGDGQLYQEDPRQARLPFRVVEDADGSVRTVDTETGEIREA